MSGDVWVFGYGSLMWRPGFDYEEKVPALLRGYHRRFCIYSHHHRGTPEKPGLVLGIAPGGDCHGIAFRVAEEKWPVAKTYLDERELINDVYIPSELRVHSTTHGIISAYTYIANLQCRQYAAHLTLHEMAQIITGAYGGMGANLDYLENTVTHLDRMGIIDPPLHDLMDLVRREYSGMNNGAGI